MTKNPARLIANLLPLLVLALVGCSGGSNDSSSFDGPASGEQQGDVEFERGAHRGRMLREGDFAIELGIFETGVPPEFHAYGYLGDKILPPETISLTVELRRFSNVVQVIKFSHRSDMLVGDQEIYEPHSFDVIVDATYRGKTFRWSYPSYEGRTTLSAESLAANGVVTEEVRPQIIGRKLSVPGVVRALPGKTVSVRTRLSGIIREAKYTLGDRVKAGAELFVIESNESLRPFTIAAPLSGVVVAQEGVAGETILPDESLIEIVDTSAVMVEASVPLREIKAISKGDIVVVIPLNGDAEVSGAVSEIGVTVASDTQSVPVRVILVNSEGLLRPGQYSKVNFRLDEREVSTAVKLSAVQKFRDWHVIFQRDGNSFEILPVELGRSDGTWVEVLSGAKVGVPYVAENSFLIKADILKHGASHDH